MVVIDNILISDDVIEKKFVCDLNKCKGGCCEVGDAGAPLTDEELDMVTEVYEKVKPYLTEASIQEIERKGKYVHNQEFGWVTPTLGSDKEICVYGVRDEKGSSNVHLNKLTTPVLFPGKSRSVVICIRLLLVKESMVTMTR